MNQRKSIRLKNYDYSQNGSYFVTICTQNREHLFGEIVDGIMRFNSAGEMVEEWYLKMLDNFETIQLGHVVIMPNHIHFIVTLESRFNEAVPLYQIVQWFKAMSTNVYIKGVKSNRFKPFDKRVWQRNYHEHIIRNEISYFKLCEYIDNNPIRWKEDILYS